jgi:hypothetical protein
MNFIEVESLDVALDAAERLGGTIVKKKSGPAHRMARGDCRSGWQRVSRLAA